MSDMMRVLVKEPGKAAEEREIPNTLEALQGIVGGYIESLQPFEDGALIVNEEGKLMGLPPNFWFCGDLIVGTAVMVGVAGEEFCGLTDEQIEAVRTMMRWSYEDLGE